MSDGQTITISAKRNEEYSSRLPQGPRIVIPQPFVGRQNSHNIELGSPRLGTLSHQLPPLQIGNMVDKDWTYRDRRSFNRILPYLYLGPAQCINGDFLANGSYTMVVGLAIRGVSLMARAVKLAESRGLATLLVPVDQIYSLAAAFPQITRAINAHVEQLGWSCAPSVTGEVMDPNVMVPNAKILLACESGIDYSAAACAAYLMETFNNVGLEKAMQICLTCRFSCHFGGTSGVLQAYEQIVKARSDVLKNDQPETRKKTAHVNVWFRRKRDQYLHNVDDEVWTDLQRFSGRNTPQPFNDIHQ
jgi:serine/threonine/tyrosine-interacting protein